jgi:hypothetical protein
MPGPIWNFFAHNLFWIGPIALPLVLFTLNAVVKVALGAFNVHAFGADMAFAAVALCAGTLFRHIAAGTAAKGSDYALSLLMLFGLVAGWIGCVALGRPRRALPTAVSVFLGCFFLYGAVCVAVYLTQES